MKKILLATTLLTLTTVGSFAGQVTTWDPADSVFVTNTVNENPANKLAAEKDLSRYTVEKISWDPADSVFVTTKVASNPVKPTILNNNGPIKYVWDPADSVFVTEPAN